MIFHAVGPGRCPKPLQQANTNKKTWVPDVNNPSTFALNPFLQLFSVNAAPQVKKKAKKRKANDVLESPVKKDLISESATNLSYSVSTYTSPGTLFHWLLQDHQGRHGHTRKCAQTSQPNGRNRTPRACIWFIKYICSVKHFYQAIAKTTANFRGWRRQGCKRMHKTPNQYNNMFL